MSVYEQIKADLGYLNLDAAAASFATLAEQARTEDWSHIEFLARLVAEQATADRNRRLAARLRYARFPYRRRLEDKSSSSEAVGRQEFSYFPANRNAQAAMMQAKAAPWRQVSASPRTTTMNTPNTVSAIASCAILSWPGVQPAR